MIKLGWASPNASLGSSKFRMHGANIFSGTDYRYHVIRVMRSRSFHTSHDKRQCLIRWRYHVKRISRVAKSRNPNRNSKYFIRVRAENALECRCSIQTVVAEGSCWEKDCKCGRSHPAKTGQYPPIFKWRFLFAMFHSGSSNCLRVWKWGWTANKDHQYYCIKQAQSCNQKEEKQLQSGNIKPFNSNRDENQTGTSPTFQQYLGQGCRPPSGQNIGKEHHKYNQSREGIGTSRVNNGRQFPSTRVLRRKPGVANLSNTKGHIFSCAAAKSDIRHADIHASQSSVYF